jgi:hypothetical protein
MKFRLFTALCAVIFLGSISWSKTDPAAPNIDTVAIHRAATKLALQFPTSTPSLEAWPRGIVHPEPIRLYRDRVNVVIVLAEGPDKSETGLYVHVPHSSYLPMSDPEWKFTPLGNGVWRYQK